MRVSIVATALDGEAPHSKTVLNMVSRMQNRNPGYYDMSSVQKNNNFSGSSNFISSTSGANALQVENEEIKNSENELLNSMVDENMAVNSLPFKEQTIQNIDNIRKAIMDLNPKGVGCKDLKEYLIFQIGDSNALSLKIIKNYFDEFLNQDRDKIKEYLNCTEQEINEAFMIISDQNFSPILDNDLGNENVLPDAIVKEKEDKWLILINDRLLNKYQI